PHLRLEIRAAAAGRRTSRLHHDRHSVRIAGVDLLAGDFILGGRGLVGPPGPLAEVHGMAAPLGDVGAREKVVLPAPAAPAVRPVDRPPRAWAEPQVPVHLVPGGLGLGGQPVVPDPRLDDAGVEGAQAAELAAAGQLLRDLEVSDAAPLGAGLVDATV